MCGSYGGEDEDVGLLAVNRFRSDHAQIGPSDHGVKIIIYILTLVWTIQRNQHLLVLVFWALTPCGLVGKYQRFGGIYCLHLQGCFIHRPISKDKNSIINSFGHDILNQESSSTRGPPGVNDDNLLKLHSNL
jgi:hypothetical protein